MKSGSQYRVVVEGAPVRLEGPDGGGRQLADPGDDSERRWYHRVESHVVVQGCLVDIRVDPTPGQQGGQRRGEAQPGAIAREVERLDPQPVPAKNQPPGIALHDREGEHPLEMIDAPLPPPVVSLHKHLGIGGREKAVAAGAQLLAEVLVVVETAVEDARQTELGIDHGLGRPNRQIDDLQAAVAERQASL